MITEGRILLVEDQREWQVELKELLKDYPYQIRIAEYLEQASDLLDEHVYDLVLLDLRLQAWQEDNFDGWELMDKLETCRQEGSTQVIMVSAYGTPHHVRAGFKKYHIADFFDKKSIDPQEFKESVAGAVEKAYEERGSMLDR